MSNDTAPRTERLVLTTEIVSSYISNNAVPAEALSGMIESVYAALAKLDTPVAEPQARQAPAVPIKASVKPDHLVCLEDGKKMKTLKRYLATRYNLTPTEYRAKWGLPKDYPMVAPAYAAQRKELALKSGLGRKPASQPAAATSPINPAPGDAVAPRAEIPHPRRKLSIVVPA